MNVNDDNTINSRSIFSFKAAGRVYHKISWMAHPTQTTQDDFEPPSYDQIYLLDQGCQNFVRLKCQKQQEN